MHITAGGVGGLGRRRWEDMKAICQVEDDLWGAVEERSGGGAKRERDRDAKRSVRLNNI